MTFLNPLGLLLLLSLPVIVLLHLFRQERRRQEVSSLFLWREVHDQQSRRIRPRLLRNINLILQLLAATAASLALAQPALPAAAGAGASRMIILMDASASMRAREGQITRLELAKNRAREVIGRSRRDTQVMIATLGPRPSVLQSFTTDRPALYEVVRSVQAADGPGNLEETARLLRRLQDGDADVHLITDGAFEPDERAVLPGRLSVEIVGTDVANRAITTFEVRRRPDGSALETYLEVANFAPEPAEVTLEIATDGQTTARRRIPLAAGGVSPVAAVLPVRRGSVFTARLTGNEDALPTDDVAHVVARSVRPVRVQLVTEGNFFLESVLAVYPDVVLTVTPTVDRTLPFDVLILDRVDAPAGVTGNLVAVASAVPGAPFVPGDIQPLVRPVTMNQTHPIAANVDLSDVNITRAQGGELEGRSRLVASSGNVPLIYTATWDRVRMVGLTFSLADTDLGLRSSFPVLMSNVIAWLAPSPQESAIGAVPAGSTVTLLVTPGETVQVVTPGGTTVNLEPRENTAEFRATDDAGVYTVTGPGFTDMFAVALTDAAESNLRPRFGSGAPGQGDAGPGTEAPGLPLWPWLALLAVALVTADWVVWARRT